jgi:hypothetical protein
MGARAVARGSRAARARRAAATAGRIDGAKLTHEVTEARYRSTKRAVILRSRTMWWHPSLCSATHDTERRDSDASVTAVL